jgi:hypothetical protein
MVLLMFAGLLTASAAAAPETAGSKSVDDAEISLPLTVEHVWLRKVKGSSMIRLSNAKGDLTIGADGVSFSTQKKTVEIPIDEVQQITYGKIKGDVDTEWVLLGVGEKRADEIVAVRDGRKLGYGQRTWEIYETMKAALGQLSAAQYRVPRGYRAFADFSRQFTLAVPEQWDTYVESLEFVGRRAPWGTIIVSSEPIRRTARPGGDGARPVIDESALERARLGEVPAFFIERMPLEKGMRCKGFSKKGMEKLLDLASEGALFQGGGRLAGNPTASPEIIDRCNGLRIRGQAAAEDGTRTEIDLHAAAKGDTLFVVGLRAIPERYEQYREFLDASLATLMFSVAQ